ncbi:Oligoribonuclease, mitochondrial [Bagarius yarrelli]|uniref:Oligoribonuclease, mitochondrial n=1 Tax=Bagarius yarrelli TaxID=175774 RepID=A0A556V575_BAGYA|nr:Oligoribonuclease, mitochondrial [Bagarius yarrelli]
MAADLSTSSSSSSTMSQRMVWVDLEMTGLDIEKDQIIEMACIITDSDLNIIAEGPNLIINQPDELLDSMSDWCKEHHGKATPPTYCPRHRGHAYLDPTALSILDTLALGDIQESIKELKFYRAAVFKPEGGEKKRKIAENGDSKQND